LTGSQDARRVCLSTLSGTSLQCRDGNGGVAIMALLLPPGDYVIEVSGDPYDLGLDGYTLRIDPTTAPAPDY
jgi:hypothetical protein